MLKNRRFNAIVTMTTIKRIKRQKFVYCIFASKNFMSSLLCDKFKKLASLKLIVRTMGWCHSTKTAKIFWV